MITTKCEWNGEEFGNISNYHPDFWSMDFNYYDHATNHLDGRTRRLFAQHPRRNNKSTTTDHQSKVDHRVSRRGYKRWERKWRDQRPDHRDKCFFWSFFSSTSPSSPSSCSTEIHSSRNWKSARMCFPIGYTVSIGHKYRPEVSVATILRSGCCLISDGQASTLHIHWVILKCSGEETQIRCFHFLEIKSQATAAAFETAASLLEISVPGKLCIFGGWLCLIQNTSVGE